mmetsp:Transcript_37238/g.71405  ORF Transcript_37238/g.71405 Transcript_37238/m.71405 type:complete len:141 (+) Transcript_37238:276-698(+)
MSPGVHAHWDSSETEGPRLGHQWGRLLRSCWPSATKSSRVECASTPTPLHNHAGQTTPLADLSRDAWAREQKMETESLLQPDFDRALDSDPSTRAEELERRSKGCMTEPVENTSSPTPVLAAICEESVEINFLKRQMTCL